MSLGVSGAEPPPLRNECLGAAHAMQQIRVLEIVEPAIGGTKRYLLQLAHRIDREEFELTLAVSTLRDPNFERHIRELCESGLRVVVVPMRRAIRLLSDWRCYRKLLALIRDGHFDVVHTHSSKAGFLGRRAAWRVKPRPRILYTPHAFAFLDPEARFRSALFKSLERTAGRWTDMLVAVSEHERTSAIEAGIVPPERTVVVENGVDLSAFAPKVLGGPVRREIGVGTEELLVGAGGRLERQKGFEYFLQAASVIRRQMESVHFLLYGAGAAKRDLVRTAADLGLGDRFHFLGEREDMPLVYAALDVLCLPSLWEGMPYALLEALAMGKPSIVSDVCGLRDVVQHGRCGLAVPPADPEALACALLRLLGDRETRAHMGGEARRLAERRFGLERFIRQMQDVYRQSAGRGTIARSR